MPGQIHRIRRRLHRALLQLLEKDSAFDIKLISDDWFFDHFVYAPRIISQWVDRYGKARAKSILDFGCGDGIMALAMASRYPSANVVGVDLHDGFKYLEDTARKQVKLERLPDNLKFGSLSSGTSPADSTGKFDLIYSWSVFEHVDRSLLPSVLTQIRECLADDGRFFVQIAPLYYSPYGSHLNGLINKPWAHLLAPEERLLSEIVGVDLSIFPSEYKNKAFELCAADDFKQYMIREYISLNKITCDELVAACHAAGFEIVAAEERTSLRRVPAKLLDQYERRDLTTSEIRMVMK